MSCLVRALPMSLLAVALLAAGSPGLATTHHHRRDTGRHHAAIAHRAKASRTIRSPHHREHHADRVAARHGAAPAGAVTVPAGGLKVYCARHSPMLVRKFNQGSGTTVTVICR